MEKNIIDVSTFQGYIDWSKLKGRIDGAILRCGYGSDIKSQDDSTFERNAIECEKLGIPYGVYLYSYATNEEMARSEAQHILRLVDGKNITYPIYLDVEEETDKCRAFASKSCEIVGDIIEKAGYMFGVYANLNWWNNYLTNLEKYTKWVAQYSPSCTFTRSYDMWQYTSGGKIEGVNGNVDMNKCYKVFDTRKQEPLKDKHTIALEVLEGLWGVGEFRKRKLTEAGYDYVSIQIEVNKLCDQNYTIALEVLEGRWGNGADRMNRLEKAGYNYNTIQQIVNDMVGD